MFFCGAISYAFRKSWKLPRWKLSMLATRSIYEFGYNLEWIEQTECYNHAAHMIYDNLAKKEKKMKKAWLIEQCKKSTVLLQPCYQELYVELGIPVKIPRSFETYPHCVQCRGDVRFQSSYFSNGYPFIYLKAFQISDVLRYTFRSSLYTELYCNENNN